MKQIDIREGARRQHRAVCLFAVIQAWIDGLDGVVFRRPDLERLLGLERFKQTRIDWLLEDLEAFFPHHKAYTKPGVANSLDYVVASRVPFQDSLPDGEMSAENRVTYTTPDGPRLGLLKLWEQPEESTVHEALEVIMPFFADRANYDERFLSAYLSLLAQGQIVPRDLPTLSES